MAQTIYRAKLRKDGTVSVPRKAKEALGLHEGDEVEVILQKTENGDREQDNPLYGLIGMAEGGPEDGAENHDAYLYGSGS